MARLKKPNLDSVTTINVDGSHFSPQPADVKGRFTSMRRWFGLILLVVYVALPWIQIKGYPALFFDLAHRRFHLFGLTFLAQDLWLAFFVIAGLGLGLFYVTSMFGRLWCGWACPYTVFLEHVYRRIERWIEGDAAARRKLEQAPWTGDKVVKRVVKHSLFILVALIIANVFLSYFVSLSSLYEYVKRPPLENAKAFGVVMFLTLALYFCFSWFREQFCIIICPYGRIQSALTDDNTMVIGYDTRRGEPRGRGEDSGYGDCVNCQRCVQVCPTGIDIRNGLQMECIGCAACVDACDAIMKRLDRPKGLVRYDSLVGLNGGRTRYLRPRVIVYTVALVLGFLAMIYLLSGLHSVFADVNRMKGQPYYVTEAGVRNQYQIRLMTKLNEPTTFRIQVVDAPDGLVLSGFDEEIILEAQSEGVRPFLAMIPTDKYAGQFELKLLIKAMPGNDELTKSVKFLGPSAYVIRESTVEKVAK